MVPDDSFSLDRTIFKSLTDPKARYLMRNKLAYNLFWSEPAAEAIEAAYSAIPAPPSIDKAITEFMTEDCDFSMEHADGSFLDHLSFCHEYAAAYFKEHSPRVLFLHSIMGVGTNCFPMPLDKEPKLRAMLTDFEYRHIQAFPSILRLLLEGRLLRQLAATNRGRLDKFRSITFHRVIDNKIRTLDAEDFWIHLNYQVMHLLDFLPAACWASSLNDPLFGTFVDLITFLRRTGLLRAGVNFEHPSGGVSVEGQPLTLGACIMRFLPGKLVRNAQIKSIQKFSRAIGHSLEYSIQWHP